MFSHFKVLLSNMYVVENNIFYRIILKKKVCEIILNNVMIMCGHRDDLSEYVSLMQ